MVLRSVFPAVKLTVLDRVVTSLPMKKQDFFEYLPAVTNKIINSLSLVNRYIV